MTYAESESKIREIMYRAGCTVAWMLSKALNIAIPTDLSPQREVSVASSMGFPSYLSFASIHHRPSNAASVLN